MTRSDLPADAGTAGEAMTREVVTLSPDAGLSDAARELERAGVSGAPVVEEGRLVGIVTLGDLISRAPGAGAQTVTTGPFHRVEHLLAARRERVRDVMTTMVHSVGRDTPIVEAAAVMVRHGVNRLPVVDRRGAPVGILTRDDVIRAVARLAERGAAPRPKLPPD